MIWFFQVCVCSRCEHIAYAVFSESLLSVQSFTSLYSSLLGLCFILITIYYFFNIHLYTLFFFFSFPFFFFFLPNKTSIRSTYFGDLPPSLYPAQEPGSELEVPSSKCVASPDALQAVVCAQGRCCWEECSISGTCNPLLWNTKPRLIITEVKRGGKEQSCVYCK